MAKRTKKPATAKTPTKPAKSKTEQKWSPAQLAVQAAGKIAP